MGKLHNFRLKNKYVENYTPIYNNVINKRQSNLSINARMLLIICLSYKDGWEINWTRFEKEEGMSTPARRSALKELSEHGYYFEEKYKDGYVWKYTHYFFGFPIKKETFIEQKGKNFEEFRNNNFDDKILTLKSKCQDFDDKIDGCINNNINNNNNLNNNIKNNTLLAETSFCHEKSENPLNQSNTCISSDSCNQDTCLHDDFPNGLTFRKDINSHDSHGESGGGVAGRKRSKRTEKGVLSNGKITRNKEELNLDQPKVSVTEYLSGEKNAIIIEEQTDEEKLIKQSTKQLMDFKAKLDEKEQALKIKEQKDKNRETWEKRIHEKIDLDFCYDETLKNKFKLFITHLRELGIVTTYSKYSDYLKQLESYETDEEKLEALTIAISYNAPKLVFDKDKKKKGAKKVSKQETESNNGIDYYFDEQGFFHRTKTSV